MGRILLFAVILSHCTSSVAKETSVEKLFAQSNPTIQEQINQVLRTIETESSGKLAALKEIESLKESTAEKEEIVKQISIFVANPDLDERQRLMAPVVLHLMQLRPRIIIRALAPHLGSDSENLRSFARNWFQAHDLCAEGPLALQALNYAGYLDYVQGQLNRDEEVPTAFINYIYERSPSQALFVFTYANPQRRAAKTAKLLEMQKKFESHDPTTKNTGRNTSPPITQKAVNPQDLAKKQQSKIDTNEILLAEHIISNAIWLKKHSFGERFPEARKAAWEQLYSLARHDQWWARLYVAEIMGQHPELRQANVLEKLSRDDNELVSKVAKSALQ